MTFKQGLGATTAAVLSLGNITWGAVNAFIATSDAAMFAVFIPCVGEAVVFRLGKGTVRRAEPAQGEEYPYNSGPGAYDSRDERQIPKAQPQNNEPDLQVEAMPLRANLVLQSQECRKGFGLVRQLLCCFKRMALLFQAPSASSWR